MEQMNQTTNPVSQMNPMPKMGKKPPYLWIAVVVIIAAGVGLMWYYMSSDLDFVPQDQLNLQGQSEEAQLEAEVNTIDTGDLDKEFESVDSDLNTL